MGQGWRRVTEAVRQKVVTDRNFKPTSNARNEAMFKEATEFAQLIKLLERDIRAMEKQVEGNFSNLRSILESALPRVYEEGQEGAVPCDEGGQVIGFGVHFESVTDAAHQMKKRLEQEVIAPLKHWMLSYRSCQDRMNQLEKLRLEVDSRRRTVDGLRGRLERVRTMTRSGSARPDHKQEQELDRTNSMLTHKDDKLQRTVEQYCAVEQTVFNSLFTLIKDTHALRDYTRMSLAIVQDCYAYCYSAYEGQPAASEHLTLQSGTAGNAALGLPMGQQHQQAQQQTALPQLGYYPALSAPSDPARSDYGGASTRQGGSDRTGPAPIMPSDPIKPYGTTAGGNIGPGLSPRPTANMYAAGLGDDAHEPQAYDQQQGGGPYAFDAAMHGGGINGGNGGNGGIGSNPYAAYSPHHHSPHNGAMHSPGRYTGGGPATAALRQQAPPVAGGGWARY